uniref:C2H2-type domain-containing protein n=1 Tax=Anopheles atroparvus TaxID=41427 RepID=A0A182JJM7_ANOAO
MFTTNNIQTATGTPIGIQYQTTTTDINKGNKLEGQKTNQQAPEFSTFYANVNMIQKLTPTSQALSTVNLAQLSDDNKTVQYLQPFGYANCALVNQMPIPNGVTGITVDGRQLVVNKPITNTISNISFKCDVCGLMFNHLTLLNHHKRTHNQDATQIFVAPDGDIKFEIGEIPNASNSNSSMDSLIPGQIHPIKAEHTIVQQQNAHPVKKRNLATVTKCNKCNGSGVIIVGGQKKHMNQSQVHHQPEKPFTCNTCGGRFSRYSSLWSHKKLHTGEKNYKCNVCGIAFAKAVYLKNHMRIHTGEKPYKCGTCGMQFSQSPHLKNHERTHSGEKPYVCEVCDKGFARHATLWNHRRIHTGEKPYKCNRCQSAFSQAAHLKNHEKVHSGLKPFKCDICSAAFADRFALKRHRGIHEKYGQTTPLHQNQQQQATQQVVHKEEIIEMDEKPREVIITGM